MSSTPKVIGHTPGAYEAGDWTDQQCADFMRVALRHVQYRGNTSPDCNDIRLGARMAIGGSLEPLRSHINVDDAPLPWRVRTNCHTNERGAAWGWVSHDTGHNVSTPGLRIEWNGGAGRREAEFLVHAVNNIAASEARVAELEARIAALTEAADAALYYVDAAATAEYERHKKNGAPHSLVLAQVVASNIRAALAGSAK